MSLVSCGSDFSMEFSWIRNDEKRLDFLAQIQSLANNSIVP